MLRLGPSVSSQGDDKFLIDVFAAVKALTVSLSCSVLNYFKKFLSAGLLPSQLQRRGIRNNAKFCIDKLKGKLSSCSRFLFNKSSFLVLEGYKPFERFDQLTKGLLGASSFYSFELYINNSLSCLDGAFVRLLRISIKF